MQREEIIQALQDHKKYSEGIHMDEVFYVMNQIQPFLKGYEGEGIRVTAAMAFILGTRQGVKQERARRKESGFVIEKERLEAKRELNDELFQLEQKITRAQLLMGDTLDGYFRKHDSSKQEDSWKIRYSFNRYAEFSEMVLDYLVEAHKLIDELTDIHSEDEPGSKSSKTA